MAADSSKALGGEPIPPRNLVLCFDGTGDWIGSDRTNVAKIFSALGEPREQCYYDGGVGTLLDYSALAAPQRLLLHTLDLANANGLRDKVLQGYLFLVRNYRAGDQIYLFGFSRGAYTARLVAAMVESFGVLRPSAENVAPYLWQAFITSSDFNPFKKSARELREQFALAHAAEIRFMGLFDTVSSVGLLSRFNVYPFTTFNPGVRRTCHAVSIDESRSMFPENLMDPTQPNLTEVWFPGVHRDVGGGAVSGPTRIADETLNWIASEARQAGLGLTDWPKPDPSSHPIVGYPTFDPYAFAGTIPLQFPMEDVRGKRYLWPNFRSVRPIPENALVHQVALEAYGPADGRPSNFPKDFVAFRTGDGTLTHESACQVKPPSWRGELVGTLFGTMLILLVWNAAVGSVLGPSWHGPWRWLEFALVLLIVPVQAVGKGTVDRLRPESRFLPEKLFPWTAGATLAVAGVVTGPTPLFVGGLLAGGLVFGAAKAWRLPELSANRALPYLLFAALGSAALVGGCAFVARRVTRFESPPSMVVFLGAVSFLLALWAIVRDRRKLRSCAAKP